MKKKPIEPSAISWDTNVSKREADMTMYRAMAFDLLQTQANGKKRLKILSFPAQTWRWEIGLQETFPKLPMEFVGIERDAAVHFDMCKFATVLPGNFSTASVPMSFIEYAILQYRTRPFNVVYLDWMGTWSAEKKKDIEMLFKNRMLALGGLLIVTVSLRRGQPETTDELADMSYDLPLAFYDARGRDKYVSNIKVCGIPRWIQNYADVGHNIALRPILASVYYSSTGLSNQIQPQLQIMMLRES